MTSRLGRYTGAAVVLLLVFVSTLLVRDAHTIIKRNNNNVGSAVHRDLFLLDLWDLFLSIFTTSGPQPVTTPHLSARQVNLPGFGDNGNQYAFGMASFKGSVYVGTLNSSTLTLQTLSFFFGLPFFQSEGAKVYRGIRSEEDGSWQFDQVLDFRFRNRNNYGVRKMLVVDEYLYFVTANHSNGLEVWRTAGAGDWTQVSAPGFGDASNVSGRGMVVCGGYLYVGAENRSTGAQIWRRQVTATGDFAADSLWEDTGTRGFGDGFNYFVSDFKEYKGHLYGSTLNGINGSQLWRTSQCANEDATAVAFENIVSGGLGNRLNFGLITMESVNDKALLLGTVNYFQGSSLFVDDGTGTSFSPVFTGGLTTFLNGYVWSMEQFQGRVYIGTYNTLGLFVPWSTFQLFSLVFDESTLEVQDLTVENRRGFSSAGQYGIRNMAVHEDSLMLGTGGSRITSGTLVFEAKALR